ncbi:hypothetical protein RUM43_008984 [Polyplax serrata]|uniref:Rhabdoid tumor deletion region protein 1 n=1 Tax=Polyplax serrata TaxID=468196 RepID=A0AAN8S8B3_POLSC
MSLACPNRHSFLLRGSSCVKAFNPRLVTRLMDKEMLAHTTYRNLEPPFQDLASVSPVVFSPNVDETRTKVAFGRWALPKLKREIYHEDIFEVMRALNSIYDLVHDPEKAYEAIRIGLVDRLTGLMLHERDFVREKVCLIFNEIAGIEAGKRAIIRRYKILNNLALLLDDKVDSVKIKAQLVIETISQSPTAATGLNSADFLVLVLRLIGGTPKTENENVVALQLATLKMLLDRDVKVLALKHNVMNILLERLESKTEKIKILALECIALLCHVAEGRAAGAELDLGLVLCKKLFDPSMAVRIKVAGALAFATIQSDTRHKLCKPCTVDILVEIMENFHSSEGQLMATKVLGNLSEDPEGKAMIKKMKKRIKAVFTNNDELIDRHKNLLLNMLKKK